MWATLRINIVGRIIVEMMSYPSFVAHITAHITPPHPPHYPPTATSLQMDSPVVPSHRHRPYRGVGPQAKTPLVVDHDTHIAPRHREPFTKANTN